MMNLDGLKYFVDHNLPLIRYAQVRFPRSRKVRMQNKWKKQPKNWAWIDATNTAYFVKGVGILVHPDCELLKTPEPKRMQVINA